MIRSAACLVALSGVLLATAARGQATPQMQVQPDADTVGVGDVVHVLMTVQSSDGQPSNPRIGATPGFVLRSANSSPTETHININGNRIDRFGVSVDWALEARQAGTFHVGPFTITIGAASFQTGAIPLKVVPAGQAPPRTPISPFGVPSPFFSPFDPWKGLFPGADNGDRHPPPASPTTDPKLSLDAPRGAYYFLHATADKASAVVGEQVTFSVYEYIDTAALGIELDDEAVHDATAADFVKRPLLREDQEAVPQGYAAVGGRTWSVKLVRRWALFPLHSGDLVIGPMTVGVARPRNAAGKRTTEAIHVQVGDAPLAGRPPGYEPGDVGQLILSADVTPRQVEEGAAVAVHAEISGTGNIPASIATPARDGVEWLPPEVHDSLGPQEHDHFGGKRAFDFVVRLSRTGDVNLGELRLPFWNPESKAYGIARAALGDVRVTPSATHASNNPPPRALPGLPAPRRSLEGAHGSRLHLDDTRSFWLLGVAAWPAAFAAAFVGRGAAKRGARFWQARRTSPLAELRRRVSAAQSAARGSDAGEVDAATERAIHAATVAHAGVNVRGAAHREDVVHRLTSAGVSKEAAGTIAELLQECEAARFAPEGSEVLDASRRWARAERVIGQLERRAR